MMQSFFSDDGFLGTEMDDKLAGTKSRGESVVVTGCNGIFQSQLVLLSQVQVLKN